MRNHRAVQALLALAMVAPPLPADDLETVAQRFPLPQLMIDGSVIDSALGDVDGDGRLDLLALTDPSPGLMVALGRGTGWFAPPTFLPTLPGLLRGIRVGLFDGDAHLDVVVASVSEYQILLGQGDGTFLPFADLPGGGSLSLGLMNEDALLDIGVGRGTQPVRVFLAEGGGAFTEAPPLFVISSVNGMALGDVDGDGLTDLLTGGVLPARYLGNGDGTFTDPKNIQGPATSTLYVTDFDGDELLDVFAGGGQALSLLTNIGVNGLFNASSFTQVPLDRIRPGDLDGDGYGDVGVVLDNTDQQFALFRGAADGSLTLAASLPTDRPPVDAVFGRFDADAVLDVAIIEADSGVSATTVALGVGDGSFVKQFDGRLPSVPLDIAVGDLDGDGLDDLVTLHAASGEWYVQLATGSGQFTAPTLVDSWPGDLLQVELGDVDGDTELDIVILSEEGSNAGALLVQHGVGDGTFGAIGTFGFPEEGRSFTLADIELDGDLDVAVAALRNVVLGINPGTGVFDQFLGLGGLENVTLVHVTDLDGDGLPDVFSARRFPTSTGVGGLTHLAEPCRNWHDLGGGSVGVNGPPTLSVCGPLTAGSTFNLDLSNAPPSEFVLLWLSFASVPLSALGGTIHANPFNNQFLRVTDASGAVSQTAAWPAGLPAGVDLYLQWLCQDLTVPAQITLSNAVTATTP